LDYLLFEVGPAPVLEANVVQGSAQALQVVLVEVERVSLEALVVDQLSDGRFGVAAVREVTSVEVSFK